MKLKSELDEIYSEMAKGAQIRSRAKYIENGEKSTSYFLNLEKIHQTKNNILKLKIGNQEYTDTGDILDNCATFYDNLYSSRKIPDMSITNYLNKIVCENVLSDENKKLCEGSISYKECEFVILKCMKDNKSPGSDGIPLEFYKTFWNLIGTFLVKVFQYIYSSGKMTNSQRKSVVSLIFKDGDRENLSNYRPISLTNTDYKIMAFVLANRLQNVLPSIISYDQTGYIKNRSINTNIRLVDDILNFSQSKKLQTAVLFLDFSKAFDSLEWNFMFQVLEKFNFGPSFIKWIKILYNEPELYIKNNGYMSRRILMDRGIRQGCPLSALLFIIAVEIFSVLCRTGTEYKGVTIDLNNKCNTIFITQYADDMCLFVENIGEVDNAIKAVDKFGLISGLCLNKAKTKILNTGEQLVETNFFDIQISSGAEKCLGIYVGTDKIKCEQKTGMIR
jgi:hypothetical protein